MTSLNKDGGQGWEGRTAEDARESRSMEMTWFYITKRNNGSEQKLAGKLSDDASAPPGNLRFEEMGL